MGPWNLNLALSHVNQYFNARSRPWGKLGYENGDVHSNGHPNGSANGLANGSEHVGSTSLRTMFIRRPLRFAILVGSVLFAAYLLLRMIHYTFAFYTSGEFIRYHMDMTPDIAIKDAPIKQIDVAALGYSAVFLYLISASQLRELLLSLSYLHANVPSQPWPILLFHGPYLDDSSLRTEFLLRLYDTIGGGITAQNFLARLEFVRIDLELPKGMSTNKVKVDPVYIDDWPGFHLMQGFFATKIFDHPRLVDRNVTYFMRLDPDVYIYKKLCYDPFEVFHSRNRKYGYGTIGEDPGWVTHDMWAVTNRFVESRDEIKERIVENRWEWPDDLRMGRMNNEPYQSYDTSFEIVKLDAFRREDIREWYKEVTDDINFIYKYRWGSGPIRFSTVNMFFDVKKDVEEYCGVRYFHNGVQGRQCSCEDQKRGWT